MATAITCGTFTVDAAAQQADPRPSSTGLAQWEQAVALDDAAPHAPRARSAHPKLVATGQSLFYSGLGIVVPTVVSAVWLWDAHAAERDNDFGAADKFIGGVVTSAFAGLGGLTLLTGAALWIAGAASNDPTSRRVDVSSKGLRISF